MNIYNSVKIRRLFVNLVFVFYALLIVSCKNESQTTVDGFWNQFDVIASYEIINGDSVLICDAENVKQASSLPWNILLKSVSFVKLDNSTEEALIEFGKCIITTENYIGVHEIGPLKLFKRDGTFLRQIGSVGQGPGEFTYLCDAKMDEQNRRIYLLPMLATQILVYDFNGNFVSTIPLPERVLYGGKMLLYPELNQILVINPINKESKDYIWLLDFKGNVIQKVNAKEYYTREIGFSEGVMINTYSQDRVSMFLFCNGNSSDFLYEYSLKENKLTPKLRIKNFNDWIFIYDLPNQYIIETAHIASSDRKSKKLIIDKLTLRGFILEGIVSPYGLLWNDYGLLGSRSTNTFALHKFASEICVESEVELTKEQKATLLNIKNMISSNEEDDCSFIFYGNFKSSL